MSFKDSAFAHVLKAIFVTPFTSFFKSDAGKEYSAGAKALLSEAAGQVALAVVTNLNDVTDLTSSAKRDLAFARIVAILSVIGVKVATSEINLAIETAVSYLKGKFGTQDVVVTDVTKQAAAQAAQAVPVTK